MLLSLQRPAAAELAVRKRIHEALLELVMWGTQVSFKTPSHGYTAHQIVVQMSHGGGVSLGFGQVAAWPASLKTASSAFATSLPAHTLSGAFPLAPMAYRCSSLHLPFPESAASPFLPWAASLLRKGHTPEAVLPLQT